MLLRYLALVLHLTLTLVTLTAKVEEHHFGWMGVTKRMKVSKSLVVNELHVSRKRRQTICKRWTRTSLTMAVFSVTAVTV